MTKNEQNTQNYNESRSIQQDQRYLNLENYGLTASKSKDEYMKCLKLLIVAFQINSNIFSFKNSKIDQQFENDQEQNILQKQALQQILCHTQNTDIIKSYGGFTRKINQVLFMLIQRHRKKSTNPSKQDNQLRFILLNQEGRIIHILFNFTESYTSKLIKFMVKHFRKLQNIFILDKFSNQQEIISMANELQSAKIAKGIILVSPHSKHIFDLSQTANLFPSSKISVQKLQNIPNDDQIETSLIFCQNNHHIIELQFNIERTLMFDKIHNFITENALQPDKISQQNLFQNQWLNNAYAWYFNIIQSQGDQLLLRLDTQAHKSLTIISKKIANFLQKKFESINYQEKPSKIPIGKCFPDLLQTIKPCIVCKECKPKYGCKNCSLEYDIGINLCVQNCFKAFHKNRIKYLPNRVIEKISIQNQDKEQTSYLNQTFQKSQSFGKSERNKKTKCDKKVEKDKKNIRLLEKHKLIKKNGTKFQRDKIPQIKQMEFKGVKLIRFSAIAMELQQKQKQKLL